MLLFAPHASADSMAIQPNGRIVVIGETWPAFGTLARLNPDGAMDSSFGEGGFVLDRRIAPLRAVAIQPDGRILASGVGGFQLARYLLDGQPDPDFGDGGVAGTVDSAQPWSLYADYGPSAIIVQPQGGILVGGTQKLGRWEAPAAVVRLYSADGSFAETVGAIPQLDGRATFESHLGGLVPMPDGSVIGAGWTYALDEGSAVLLVRFLPGSGTPYDPAFGNGKGLVRPVLMSQLDWWPTRGSDAVAQDPGGKLLVAGRASGTFLLVRFSQDGILDTSFGEGGFSNPPIEGPSSGFGDSWANGAETLGDGRTMVVGATSQWGRWKLQNRFALYCEECPQPMLARFTVDGQLDQSFGSGGLLRLLRPNGEIIEGEAKQVEILAGGKMLVKGSAQVRGWGTQAPFIARLNEDGTYDPSFAEGGLTFLQFPCVGKPDAVLRREGCLPTALVKLRVRGIARGRPSVWLRMKSSLPWAQIRRVEVVLPKALRPRRDRAAMSRMAVFGIKDGRRFRLSHPYVAKSGKLFFRRLRLPEVLNTMLLPGSLRTVEGPWKRGRLAFQVKVYFAHDHPSQSAGEQILVLRRPGG